MKTKTSKLNLSRRKMLKTSSLVAAGVGTATLSKAASKESSSLPHSGKVAIITGGARGIGRAIAIALAQEGANIVICDIADQMSTVPYPMAKPEDLETTKKLIEAKGVKCLSLKADVRNSGDLKDVTDKTIESFGRIDMVIANAGIANMGFVEQMDDAAWEDVIDVNLVGVARTLKATIPHIRKQDNGRIVVIASVSGRGGSPGMSAYNSSKWGVIGLTKSIAGEVGSANITCNAICPTAIATPMIENDFVTKMWNPKNPTSEGIDEVMKQSHLLPVGKLDPLEIANAAVFLCSDKANSITGIALDVAAGSTARNSA